MGPPDSTPWFETFGNRELSRPAPKQDNHWYNSCRDIPCLCFSAYLPYSFALFPLPPIYLLLFFSISSSLLFASSSFIHTLPNSSPLSFLFPIPLSFQLPLLSSYRSVSPSLSSLRVDLSLPPSFSLPGSHLPT